MPLTTISLDEPIIVACQGKIPRGDAKTQELIDSFEKRFREALSEHKKPKIPISIYRPKKAIPEIVELAITCLDDAILHMKQRARGRAV